MNMQIFHLHKFDLKGIEGHKSLFNFSVNPALLNTLIYESIFIKIYMNANIINTQIFHLNKYDLKGHKSSSNFVFFLKHIMF